LGWLIAHQAAVYDFSLNHLLKLGSPIRPELFKAHLPGTSGDYSGTSIEEMYQYYDECEQAFMEWLDSTNPEDFERIVDEDRIPEFFRGMSVREIVSNLFIHLNHHNGHLSSIKDDLRVRRDTHI
jgi:hypothetical protein